MSTTVLITGASRGLGKGLLERYLLLPNHIVIAANRAPDQPSSQELLKLPAAEGSKLVLVKLDATVWDDAFEAAATLKSKHGIDHLDVVIGNAGVSYTWPKVRDVKPGDIEGHLRPNMYGFVALFQAMRPLLERSSKQPVLVNMSGPSGSMTAPIPYPNGAYGPSKAAAHWYTIKIHMEEEWLTSFIMYPGWVRTELGEVGANGLSIPKETQDKLMIGLAESCDGMMKILAETSREKHGGRMVDYRGAILPL